MIRKKYIAKCKIETERNEMSGKFFYYFYNFRKNNFHIDTHGKVEMESSIYNIQKNSNR